MGSWNIRRYAILFEDYVFSPKKCFPIHWIIDPLMLQKENREPNGTTQIFFSSVSLWSSLLRNTHHVWRNTGHSVSAVSVTMLERRSGESQRLALVWTKKSSQSLHTLNLLLVSSPTPHDGTLLSVFQKRHPVRSLSVPCLPLHHIFSTLLYACQLAEQNTRSQNDSTKIILGKEA